MFGENIKLVDRNVNIEEIERDFNDHISRTWTSDDIKKEVSEYDKNILVFLNEYLYAAGKGLQFAFTEKYDIEHIVPASGRNQPQIRQDAGIPDADEFMDWVNKLGNKLLLEEDINRSISNEWFRTKIQTSVTDKRGYKNSRYAIPAALVEAYKNTAKPYWLKSDIIAATDKIAKRISCFIFCAVES